MRLDRFLVECGVGSRSDVKKWIKKNQVIVNAQIAKTGKMQIDEKNDTICLENQKLVYEQFVYYMLNKPQGVLSATEDRNHQTVLDLLDETARQKAVFPVGRLDIDTHGLLLLTNNGPLAHALLSPKKHVEKCYQVQIAGIMTTEDIEAFAQGISLKDFICQPAHLNILEIDEKKHTSCVEITLSEGKFHQVKRMVKACGKEVTDLKRLRMGPLQLDPQLKRGAYRRLTTDEVRRLEECGVEV